MNRLEAYLVNFLEIKSLILRAIATLECEKYTTTNSIARNEINTLQSELKWKIIMLENNIEDDLKLISGN